MTSLLLGVDGGNTKSIAIVTDTAGRVLGSGRSGCGDMYGSSRAEALAELDRAIGEACRQAGALAEDVVGAGFSLAGADWPEDFTFLRTEMAARLGGAAKIVVVNDAIGALRAGTRDGDGVAVVCGTGSAIGSHLGEKTWHASFWGEDRGALSIGQSARRAMLRADLGLDPTPGFGEAALVAFGADSVSDLLHQTTRLGAPRTMLAALAPLVLDAAEDGDPIALRIILDAGRTLAEYVGVATRKVGYEHRPYPLVLAGGMFRHPGLVLRSEILAASPGASPVDAGFEPVVGALLLAFDHIDGRPDLDLLRASLPPAALFATTPSVDVGTGRR
jgi:N-acetylglucosamine kinase-like BadF-type ATPase